MTGTQPVDGNPGTRSPSVLRVGVTSLVGTAMEFYDLQIYGTATALVLPQLFFPTSDPFVGTLLAFSSLAISYASRPLGGVIFGHLGDRIGRKRTLVATLLVMGVATVGIGVLPTYQSIGVAAPVLLILLRLVQSMAYGGEWGGAVLVAYENAPPGRRNFFASMPQTGLPLGTLLGDAVWVVVTTALSHEELLAWGWRIPFLTSVLVVLGGIAVRMAIGETPEFQRLVQDTGARAKRPVAEAFREHWREMLLTGGSFLGFGVNATIAITYLIQYSTVEVGAPKSAILNVLLISTAVQLVVMLGGGLLADRFGTRRILLIGAIGTAVTIFPQCMGVSTGRFGWMLAGYLLCFAGFSAVCYGSLAALFATAFRVKTRYSGLSIGFQLATVIGGTSPLVAATLVRGTGSIVGVAVFIAAMLMVSTGCLLVLSRRFGSELEHGSNVAETARANPSVA